MKKIILASGSAIRARILDQAGVPFTAKSPDVDEAAIKDASVDVGLGLEEIALALAEAKTMKIARQETGLVIGSDQILEFEGRAYDKPKSMEEARSRLRELQGKSHTLINAVCVARDGDVIWRHVDRPKLKVRRLTDDEIDAYLTAAGDGILSSVGAYQVEALGARLFDEIEGDFFAVLGLSLYPLLNILRGEGAIPY